MNEIPINWATELKAAYPAKSGPVGWGSMKLLLALRRALMQSTWGEIIDGCKRYKAYCEQSGRQGTEFVQNPLRFIEDGCHLEDFTYQAPQTKEQQELAAIRARDEGRYLLAKDAAARYGLTQGPGESVGSFETRVELARQGLSDEAGRSSGAQVRRPEMGSRIAELANRLRVAK